MIKRDQVMTINKVINKEIQETCQDSNQKEGKQQQNQLWQYKVKSKGRQNESADTADPFFFLKGGTVMYWPYAAAPIQDCMQLIVYSIITL